MVMCGIGGRTIAEAKSRLTYREFLSWCKFRSKRGSLHIGMRVERGSALLAALYANTHSKESYKLYDFMPHEEEPVISLDQALETWA